MPVGLKAIYALLFRLGVKYASPAIFWLYWDTMALTSFFPEMYNTIPLAAVANPKLPNTIAQVPLSSYRMLDPPTPTPNDIPTTGNNHPHIFFLLAFLYLKNSSGVSEKAILTPSLSSFSVPKYSLYPLAYIFPSNPTAPPDRLPKTFFIRIPIKKGYQIPSDPAERLLNGFARDGLFEAFRSSV